MSFFDDLYETAMSTPAEIDHPDHWGKHKFIERRLRLYSLSVYSLCVHADPEVVIDIGTGDGFSALSMAYALKTLGRPLSALTTIDLSLGRYETMPRVASDLLDRYDLDMGAVKTVESNFLDLDPAEYLSGDSKRVMIFYDIHDDPDRGWHMGEKFLAEWVPRIKQGLVGVHDMRARAAPYPWDSEAWQRPSHPRSYSHAVHWSGVGYVGFEEAAVFVEWLNKYHAHAVHVPSTVIMYFWAWNGRPL